MEELKVTPPASWSTRRGEIMELPSGNVARLRTISLSVCLFAGNVPNQLSALVKDVVEEGQAAVTRAAEQDLMPALEMQSWIVEQAMLDPKIHVGDGPPADGEIEHGDLTDEDRSFVSAYALRGAAALEPFREKRGGAEPGHNGEEIRAAPVRDHAD